jgi:hydrogenase small subunit
MTVSRRDFLRASSALAAAFGMRIPDVFGADEPQGSSAKAAKTPVVWLEAGACSGCSVSLLNSIHYFTIDELLLNTLDLKYHSTVMAGAGSAAVSAAQAALAQGGYVLCVEGAIPTAENGKYCYLWPGLTALQGVRDYAANASVVLAVGTCAAYGGVVGGNPNPTLVRPLQDILAESSPDKMVVNIPGCPCHPDWLVGTVAHLLGGGEPENLPSEFFGECIHGERCPNYPAYEAGHFGWDGCLRHLGCKGPSTYSDCPMRKWNSPGKGEFGVNWCIGSRSPCIGCTEYGFPDEMSPFFQMGGKGAEGGEGTEAGGDPPKGSAPGEIDAPETPAPVKPSPTRDVPDRSRPPRKKSEAHQGNSGESLQQPMHERLADAKRSEYARRLEQRRLDHARSLEEKRSTLFTRDQK